MPNAFPPLWHFSAAPRKFSQVHLSASSLSGGAPAGYILVSVSLAPGTQWSQKPRLRLPAAKAPCTNGALSAVVAVAAAAVCNTVRRLSGVFPMFPSLLRMTGGSGFFLPDVDDRVTSILPKRGEKPLVFHADRVHTH